MQSRVYQSVARRLVCAAGGTICTRRQTLRARLFLAGLALILAAGSWRPAPTLAQLPSGTPTFNVNAKWVTDRGSQVYNVKAYGATGNGTADDTNAIKATITAAGAGGTILFPPGSYVVSSQVAFTYNYETIWGYGANIICNMASATDCFYIGTTGGPFYNYSGITFYGLGFQPGTNMAANSAIVDNGFDVTFRDVHGTFVPGNAHSFLHIITNYNDQNEIIEHLYTPLVTTCTVAASCGSAIYAPSSSSGITHIKDSDLSVQCNGNGIDWQGSNDLIITHTFFQTWSQFAIRTASKLTTLDSSNYIEQGGACPNPLNDGNGHALGWAGVIALGGVINASDTLGGVAPLQFSTNAIGGSTNYWYYVVGHTSGGGVTAPLIAGYLTNGPATVSGSAEVFPVWPPLSATSITTFDLLRTPRDTVPTPGSTGNWAVATGLSAATYCSSNGACSYTDSVGSPSSYTVATENTYPIDTFWPGELVLFSGATTNPINVGEYSGPVIGTGVVDSAPSDLTYPHLLYNSGGGFAGGDRAPFGPGITWWDVFNNRQSGTVGIYSSTTQGLDFNSVTGLKLPSVTFPGSTSGSASISVPAAAGSTSTILLPTTDPTSGQVLTAGTPGGGKMQTNWATPGIPPSYSTVDNNGTPLTQRSTLNFIGTGGTTVSCADNSGASRTDCTLSSPGSSATYGGFLAAFLYSQGYQTRYSCVFCANQVAHAIWPMPFSASVGGWEVNSSIYTGAGTLYAPTLVGLAYYETGATPVLAPDFLTVALNSTWANYTAYMFSDPTVAYRAVTKYAPVALGINSPATGPNIMTVLAQVQGTTSIPIGGNLNATGVTAATPLFSSFATSGTGQSNEALVEVPIPLANGGTISNFSFYNDAAEGSTGTLIATMRQGVGASGAMGNTTVTATMGNSQAALSLIPDNGHSFTVAQFDRITVNWTASTVTSAGIDGWSAMLAPNSPATAMFVWPMDGITLPAGGSKYFPAFGVNAQTYEAFVREAVPRAITIKNLVCYVTGAPAGASQVITLYHNGLASALTTTINTTDSIPEEVSDTIHSVSLVAGDTYSLQASNAGGSTAAAISACSAEGD